MGVITQPDHGLYYVSWP